VGKKKEKKEKGLWAQQVAKKRERGGGRKKKNPWRHAFTGPEREKGKKQHEGVSKKRGEKKKKERGRGLPTGLIGGKGKGGPAKKRKKGG